MDHEQRRRNKRQQRSPSRGDGASASSGKHRGGGGGGRKPIKVVYISNPMRVKTSAAGFRALVQELTGRHADPSNSKYGQEDTGAATAASLDCGATAQGLSPPGAAASSETIVVASLSSPSADHLRHDAGTQQGGDCDCEEDDGFGSQLLENNNYAVLSPTLLYDHHLHSKFPFG